MSPAAYRLQSDRTLAQCQSVTIRLPSATPAPLPPLTTTMPTTWLDPHPALPAGAKVSGVIPHGDLLIVAHGDWAANTGPTDVLAHDLADGDAPITLLTNAPTEAFESGAVIDGALWLPWIDPTGGDPGGATTDAGGQWRNVVAVPMIHAFHAATFTGSDIWLVGSRSVGGSHHGCAVRSVDGGQSWDVALSVAGPRFVSAVPAWGALHIFADRTRHAYTDQGWESHAWDSPTGRPVLASGVMFAHNGWWDGEGGIVPYEPRDPSDYAGRVDQIAYLSAGASGALAVMADGRLTVAEQTASGWRWSTLGVLDRPGPVVESGGAYWVTSRDRIGRVVE